MKIIIFSFLIISLLIMPASGEVKSSLWRTEKSQHFIIYFQEASDGFINELIYKAEDYYNGIVDELGFRRFDFWSWDNRAKIFLYQNSEDFRANTARDNWSGAVVTVANRTIESFIGQSGFLDSILPHEMAHIIFREFVGQRIVLPLWIDEGVACSQEKSYLVGRMKVAKKLILENNYLKFDKLFEIYSLGQEIKPEVFYSQSASIVNFMINQYGKESFLDFSRKIRDGVNWQRALFSVYRFNSTYEMEEAWKAFLLK